MSGSARPSTRVLREPVPRILLGAQLLSELGDWAARGALQIVVLERTRSPVWSALVVAASLAPWIGPGQLLAAAVERLDKRRVMIGCDLIRAGLFAVLIVRLPAISTIGLLFLGGLATPVFEANRSALLRTYTTPENYASALGVANVVVQGSLVAGYVAGGWAVATVGASIAIAADAATFVASALLSLCLPKGERSPASPRQALRAGISVFLQDSVIRWIMALLCTAAAMSVVVEAIAAPYIVRYRGEGAAWVGVTLASVPLGLLLVSTVVPFGNGPRRQLRTGAATSAVAAAGALVAFSLDPGTPLLLLAFVSAGAMLGCLVPCNAVFGTRVPVEVQGTAFSLFQGALMTVQGLGAVVGGLLAEAIGERVTCLLAAVVTLSVSSFLFWRPPSGSSIRRPTALSELSPL